MRKLLATITVTVGVLISPALTPPVSAHYVGDYFSHTWDTDYEECHLLIFFDCHTHNRDINLKAVGPWTAESLSTLGNAAWQVGADIPSAQYLNINWQGLSAAGPTDCDSSNYNNNTAEWYTDTRTDWLGAVWVCYNGATTIRNFRIFFNYTLYNEFYFGTSGDTPKWGYKATAMHEIVHGLGFGIGAPNSHFPDPSSDGVCPDAFDSAGNGRHVMCTYINEGTDIYELRSHDWETTADAYGGIVT